jgi:hypothetical protein
MNIAAEIYIRLVAKMSGPVAEGELRAAFDRARLAEAVFLRRDMDLTDQELGWLERFFVACREEQPLFGAWLSTNRPAPGADFPVQVGHFAIGVRNKSHTRTFGIPCVLRRYNDRAGFSIEAITDSIETPRASFSAEVQGDGFRPEEPRRFVDELFAKFVKPLCSIL